MEIIIDVEDICKDLALTAMVAGGIYTKPTTEAPEEDSNLYSTYTNLYDQYFKLLTNKAKNFNLGEQEFLYLLKVMHPPTIKYGKERLAKEVLNIETHLNTNTTGLRFHISELP